MAIDMRQFHQTFFDESLEGLAHMETELLRMEKAVGDAADPNAAYADPAIMNSIFRAAHSIKGGSWTLGFNDVATFSHALESLLDALRDGRLHPDRHLANLLLQSVDCLRSLIRSAQTGHEVDRDGIDAVHAQLRALQGEEMVKTGLFQGDAAGNPETAKTRFQICFRPNLRLFDSGNDPLRIMRELAGLGEIEIKTDLSALPQWEQMDPEACYLAWNICLVGQLRTETVNEVFDWVMDDCDTEITSQPLASMPDSAAMIPAAASEPSADVYADSIRVSIDKVDALINMVGELVITQSMLSQVAKNFTLDSYPRLFAGLSQLERNTRELQDRVMRIRMLPLSFAFNRFPRLVRDMSQKLGKKVELKISGENTELDKIVIERINDPLMHLVRNCLDHGLEPPAERLADGKPETGVIDLKAYQKGGNVVIEISDDGRGIQRDKILAKAVASGLVQADANLTDAQISELVFTPGFSTAAAVSDVSGRGVGMDVVRSNIASLGGAVDITSQNGKGTRFTVRLPLTLAILEGLSVQVGSHVYILPLVSIAESIRLGNDQVSRPAGGAEVFPLRQEYLPLIRLYELFHVQPRSTDLSQGSVVVVEIDDKKVGLYVDDLLGQQQVVIKNLEAHYRKVEGISAATILGDGMVAMILDVSGLIRLAHADLTRSFTGFRNESVAAIHGLQEQPPDARHAVRA
jgi:two-component system chemotaxis sensor kinase CheA